MNIISNDLEKLSMPIQRLLKCAKKHPDLESYIFLESRGMTAIYKHTNLTSISNQAFPENHKKRKQLNLNIRFILANYDHKNVFISKRIKF